MKAQPRRGHATNWISSTTATSTGCVRSAISTVHATWRAPGAVRRSWPVCRLHGTPAAATRSAASHASSRSGAQYAPLRAASSAASAACVLPLLGGPTCKMTRRRAARAAGYHRAGCSSCSSDAAVANAAVEEAAARAAHAARAARRRMATCQGEGALL